MTQNWPPDAENRYRAMVAEQTRRGCLGLTVVALSLFPIFGLLDYLAHPEHVEPLWGLRAVTVLVFLVLLLLQRRGRLGRHPYALAVGMALFAAVSITAMCLIHGGYQSPYYAGINLIILALVLVLPVGAARVGLAVGLVLAVYVIGMALDTGARIDDPVALFNNLYFLLATAVIGIIAAHLTERMRRQSFARLLAAERAQADLQQSRDMLQHDLASEQENVELLVREITERKAELEHALAVAQAARDEAQRALQVREEFISLASHELNTPLTTLKLQTELAQRRFHPESGLSPESAGKLIGAYESQIQRLIHMVADMFDISRIKSGRLELSPAALDLAELVRGVVERTVADDEEGEVTVRVEGRIHGEWDRFRLEQVFVNLLTNARKYGAGKPVEIRLCVERSMAVVRVRDQGIGIDPESQRRIFERFERAVGSREFGGLGLGLYISRQIVEAHGGAIEVESRAGEGATFIVRLPLPKPRTVEPDASLVGATSP